MNSSSISASFSYSEVSGANLVGFLADVKRGKRRLPKRVRVYFGSGDGWFPEVEILRKTIVVKENAVSFQGKPWKGSRSYPVVFFYWSSNGLLKGPKELKVYEVHRIWWQ